MLEDKTNQTTYNLAGVELSSEQIDKATSGSYNVNVDGKVVAKYTRSLLDGFNQDTYSKYNLTGIEPFADHYNLEDYMQKMSNLWSPNGKLEFEEVQTNSSSNERDFIQIALCPNLSYRGDSINGFAKNFGSGKRGITGSRICLTDDHIGTFSHEIGHVLGEKHPNKIYVINEQFEKAGLDVETSSVMNSYRSSKRPKKPQPFDQELFSLNTFGEPLGASKNSEKSSLLVPALITLPIISSLIIGSWLFNN